MAYRSWAATLPGVTSDALGTELRSGFRHSARRCAGLGTLLIGFGLGASLLAIEVPAARLAKLREGHEAPQLIRDVGGLWAALPTPFFCPYPFWLLACWHRYHRHWRVASQVLRAAEAGGRRHWDQSQGFSSAHPVGRPCNDAGDTNCCGAHVANSGCTAHSPDGQPCDGRSGGVVGGRVAGSAASAA